MQNHAFMSTANFCCIFVETWLATLHICRKLAGTFAYFQFVAKCVHKLDLQIFLQRFDSFEFHARGQLKNCNLLKTFENVHSAQGVSRWKASLLVYWTTNNLQCTTYNAQFTMHIAQCNFNVIAIYTHFMHDVNTVWQDCSTSRVKLWVPKLF